MWVHCKLKRARSSNIASGAFGGWAAPPANGIRCTPYTAKPSPDKLSCGLKAAPCVPPRLFLLTFNLSHIFSYDCAGSLPLTLPCRAMWAQTSKSAHLWQVACRHIGWLWRRVANFQQTLPATCRTIFFHLNSMLMTRQHWLAKERLAWSRCCCSSSSSSCWCWC